MNEMTFNAAAQSTIQFQFHSRSSEWARWIEMNVEELCGPSGMNEWASERFHSIGVWWICVFLLACLNWWVNGWATSQWLRQGEQTARERKTLIQIKQRQEREWNELIEWKQRKRTNWFIDLFDFCCAMKKRMEREPSSPAARQAKGNNSFLHQLTSQKGREVKVDWKEKKSFTRRAFLVLFGGAPAAWRAACSFIAKQWGRNCWLWALQRHTTNKQHSSLFNE